MNLSSGFNNSRIERDTETYIFEFESLSDMNYARYGAGYATDNEYIYAFGGADSEGVIIMVSDMILILTPGKSLLKI